MNKYVDFFIAHEINLNSIGSKEIVSLWSVGYCKGNIIVVTVSPGTIKKNSLYKIVYSYNKSNTYCRIHACEPIADMPISVKDMECEMPYMECFSSFRAAYLGKTYKIYECYFLLKEKNSVSMVHVLWKDRNKEQAVRNIRTEFPKGYPWKIKAYGSKKEIPDDMQKEIQSHISNGSFIEWQVYEF